MISEIGSCLMVLDQSSLLWHCYTKSSLIFRQLGTSFNESKKSLPLSRGILANSRRISSIEYFLSIFISIESPSREESDSDDGKPVKSREKK